MRGWLLTPCGNGDATMDPVTLLRPAGFPGLVMVRTTAGELRAVARARLTDADGARLMPGWEQEDRDGAG